MKQLAATILCFYHDITILLKCIHIHSYANEILTFKLYTCPKPKIGFFSGRKKRRRSTNFSGHGCHFRLNLTQILK